MTRWFYLWSSYGELAGGGRSVRRYAGSWSYIQRSTWNRENEGTTDNLRCMLYSVYAALSVNSWWWHGEIESDDLTLCSCDDGSVVEEKERDGEWRGRWEWCGGYVRLWEITSMTCLIGFRRPCIGVIPCQIGTRTCHIRDGQLTRTWNALSPSFLWWFPPSPLISLFLVLNSTITYEHEVKSSLSISPCHDQKLTPSAAYTKYSIHQVQHTPRTAYTKYSIHRV